VARVSASSASTSSNPGDAVAPGTPGGDDDMQMATTSKVVVVAGLIGWRRRVEGWSELACVVACVCAIPVSARAICCGSLRREER
jgi:hypothetical protein